MMKTAQPSWRIAYPEVAACAAWGAASTAPSTAGSTWLAAAPRVATEDVEGAATKLGVTKLASTKTATAQAAMARRLEEDRRAILIGIGVGWGRRLRVLG